MTEEDEGWRQPWLLTVGHDVAVTVVLPELVRDGFQVKINITEERATEERRRVNIPNIAQDTCPQM